ncbi:Hypothetical protein HVR_LOCUS591 [uncultured virus]|nr:Hypothetical protein HVR_LOCUS591 [uncultured virus]
MDIPKVDLEAVLISTITPGHRLDQYIILFNDIVSIEELNEYWLKFQEDTTNISDHKLISVTDEIEQSEITRNFNRLFFDYRTLTQKPNINVFIVTSLPDGQAQKWQSGKSIENFTSERGPKVNEILTQSGNTFGMCLTLEWKCNISLDIEGSLPASLNVFNGMENQLKSITSVKDIILTNLPSEIVSANYVLDCWFHFRNTNRTLLEKYGPPPRSEESLTEYALKPHLYSEYKFDELFSSLVEIDTEENRNQLLIAATFIDCYIIRVIRLTPELSKKFDKESVVSSGHSTNGAMFQVQVGKMILSDLNVIYAVLHGPLVVHNLSISELPN